MRETPVSSPRSHLRHALVVTLSLSLGSCIESESWTSGGDAGGIDTNQPRTSAEDTRRVLANVGENVVLPAYRQLAADLRALESATERLAASGSEADRDAAREAWRAAMQSAQRAEVYQLGPSAPAGMVAGAVGLRDEIYAWPLVNRCRIDQETTESAHEATATLRAEALNVRGLSAIEYLLFEETLENGCPPTSTINASGAWAALGDAAVRTRRARYAHTASSLARESAEALVTAWEAGFLAELGSAGAGSTIYPTAQDGLNALSDALFYLYEPVLDMKLGTPAGLVACTAPSCPEAVESRWADGWAASAGGTAVGASRESIVTNLEAFRAAYLGGEPGVDGAGFDDLLRAIGADGLDRRMREGLEAAIAAAEAIEGPLSVAVVSRNAQVVAAYEALYAFCTLFKTELVTLLDLELPMRVEGDND